ncbi:flagellar protein FliT [Planococcus sp. FY231025]|uniref:flagellar protein FliT n=1 Tax=Planococcus sp. FY231025 TaxID=3455699 RepID=UPI003F8F6EBA
MYGQYLIDLLGQTKELHAKASAIDAKMENNEDGQLEELQALFEKRQETIAGLSASTESDGFHWTAVDREKISELKELEETLQPMVKGLYRAFGEQLNRINQTKQMSKKYIGAYQNMGAGGSFIDKRK